MADSGSHRPASHSVMGLKAVAGSPEDVAGALVIYHLYSLLRAATMYAPGHPHVTQQSRRFVSAIGPQFDTIGATELIVTFVGNHVHVNRRAVRSEAAEFARAQWLIQKLCDLGIVEVSMKRGVDELELVEFCRRFAEASRGVSGFEELRGRALTVTKTRFLPEFEELLSSLLLLDRYPIVQLYADGLSQTREWSQTLRALHRPDDVPAKRLVAQIIDAWHADTGGLLGMLTFRPLRGSFSNRRFDTCILATSIALALGLGDLAALEIGVSSLLMSLPEDWGSYWQRRPAPPEDAAAIALRDSPPLETIMSYEAMTGRGLTIDAVYYGEERYKHVATLVHNVAEAWVHLLHPDEGRNAFRPAMAMQMVLAHSGTMFDAEVVKALLNMMGFYPPGSVVRLNSGDLAVVVEPPEPGSDLRRPTVRPLDMLAQHVYPLHSPELAAYAVVDDVSAADCPVNPHFVFLR